MWTAIILTPLVILNLAVLLFFAYRFREMVTKHRDELLNVRKEFKIMTSSISEMGCHLLDIERQLADVGDKQSEMVDLSQQQYDGSEAADYDQAKRLVEMGADVDEIMTACHLTRAEAELLEHVQSQARHC